MVGLGASLCVEVKSSMEQVEKHFDFSKGCLVGFSAVSAGRDFLGSRARDLSREQLQQVSIMFSGDFLPRGCAGARRAFSGDRALDFMEVRRCWFSE